jgi:predicted phosphoribosyltransferase
MAAFANREDAGRKLADLLTGMVTSEAVVLALPRGGVPVALEIARRWRAPLDVMIVRKLGFPGHEEYAMGAIASGGFQVINPAVVAEAGVSKENLLQIAARELREIERREDLYRGGATAPILTGRTVILVDDGIATGASVRVAVQAVRAAKPAGLIIAVPVAAPAIISDLRCEADEVITVLAPAELISVGEWYDDFSQLTDEEVRSLLAATSREV